MEQRIDSSSTFNSRLRAFKERILSCLGKSGEGEGEFARRCGKVGAECETGRVEEEVWEGTEVSTGAVGWRVGLGDDRATGVAAVKTELAGSAEMLRAG